MKSSSADVMLVVARLGGTRKISPGNQSLIDLIAFKACCIPSLDHVQQGLSDCEKRVAARVHAMRAWRPAALLIPPNVFLPFQLDHLLRSLSRGRK